MVVAIGEITVPTLPEELSIQIDNYIAYLGVVCSPFFAPLSSCTSELSRSRRYAVCVIYNDRAQKPVKQEKWPTAMAKRLQKAWVMD